MQAYSGSTPISRSEEAPTRQSFDENESAAIINTAIQTQKDLPGLLTGAVSSGIKAAIEPTPYVASPDIKQPTSPADDSESTAKKLSFQDILTAVDIGLIKPTLKSFMELGTRITERLGVDFGPQGKVLEALGAFTDELLIFSQTISDSWKDLFSKTPPVAMSATSTAANDNQVATAAGKASGDTHNAVVSAAAAPIGATMGEEVKKKIESSIISIPGIPSSGGSTQPSTGIASSTPLTSAGTLGGIQPSTGITSSTPLTSTGTLGSTSTITPGSVSAASNTPISGAIDNTASSLSGMPSMPGLEGLDSIKSKSSENVASVVADMDAIDSRIATSTQKTGEAQTKTSEGFNKQLGAASASFSAIAGMISSVAGLLKASSDAKIAGIDKEIAAEQKRDGKSAASVAKIDALEKKKDAAARKSFNIQKKLMIAQAVMGTAAGITMALATLPPPFSYIMAGITGAIGMAQLAIISGMQFESSYAPKTAAMPTTLSIGKRNDSVDLAKGPNASAGGEVGYLRGSEGQGTNATNYRTVGSAYGGELMRGYGNRGFVVGEKGPEVITPETPISVTPANDVGSAQPINANFTIQALDSNGVQDILVSQKGNIIKMLREAANASGKTFMEDVNVNVYTRPSVGKL
jgi:hypothetical protein